MKTVSFDDEAYRLLKAAKRSPSESFSDVVKRSLGPKREVGDSAGGWAGVPQDRLARLKRERDATFGTTTGERT